MGECAFPSQKMSSPGRLPVATQNWLLNEAGYPACRLDRFHKAAAKPAATGVRINTLLDIPRSEVLQRLAALPSVGQENAGRALTPEQTPDMILFPCVVDELIQPDPELQCMVIGRLAAEAVMQGAVPYAPGVAAAPQGYSAGLRCNLFGDAVDMYKSRGAVCLAKECLEHGRAGRLVFLGIAEALQSRNETFGGQQKGQAVRLVHPVHALPSLNGVLPDLVTLHGFPSSLVAHALAPQPGEKVLDMCSSPGGKAIHVATLMQNTGTVTAIDRTATKVNKVLALAKRFGLTNVMAHVRDSSEGVMDLPGWPFDCVLLDPTCSALGLRPRLSFEGITCEYLQQTAKYQRKLLHSAVQALRPGGTLLYSTCTINPLENEGNVAWALSTFPNLELAPLGLEADVCPPGLPILGLSDQDAKLVARYEGLSSEDDLFTGFFIAKFVKRCM